MKLVPFHVYTFLGSWPWCFGLAWVGMTLGEKWDSDPRLKAAFHSADALIGVVLVALPLLLAIDRFFTHGLRDPRLVRAVSAVIACFGAYWLAERIFGVG
jgi:hypothetical protein